MASLLSDRSHAEDLRTFPTNPDAAGKPGLYSFWADATARELTGQVLGVPMPELIYVGQAGATQNGKRPKTTLKGRIQDRHIRAVSRTSTFALAISAILLEPLNLRVESAKKLASEDRQTVSGWIKDHLQVVIAPFEDRDSLECIEKAVIKLLDPPLNLKWTHRTAARQRLENLRTMVRRPYQ
jgi:hypothetical protein